MLVKLSRVQAIVSEIERLFAGQHIWMFPSFLLYIFYKLEMIITVDLELYIILKLWYLCHVEFSFGSLDLAAFNEIFFAQLIFSLYEVFDLLLSATFFGFGLFARPNQGHHSLFSLLNLRYFLFRIVLNYERVFVDDFALFSHCANVFDVIF